MNLKAGIPFKAGKQGGTVGAFLRRGNKYVGVTAAHVLRYAGASSLTMGRVKAEVVHVWRPFDLAYFKAPECELTPMANPSLGDAQLVNAFGTKSCRIANVGALTTVVFQCADMPGPGESGSPIFQDEKVVGILSSINLNDCKGTIISSEIIKKGAERFY
jgi:hypothetical protein